MEELLVKYISLYDKFSGNSSFIHFHSAPLDYQDLRETLSIEAGEQKSCAQVKLTDDAIPEISKDFTVIVSADDSHPDAILNPGNATVIILDDDRKLQLFGYGS